MVPTRKTGRYEVTTTAGETVRAFLPSPLPPRKPPLALDGELTHLLQDAEHALARLELAGAMVPSIHWFLYGFIRKEAVLSSRIEGAQTTMLDLLAYEASERPDAKPSAKPGGRPSDRPSADLEEVCNYLEALTFAREELRRSEGLPISMRLLNEVHRRLMAGVRGADRRPGEIRKSQNWIGGTRPGNAIYVPPPPHVLPEMLSDLERYLHTQGGLPALVKIALLHAQFESLHPYLDGNGRTGRMLITLLLEGWGLLSQPLLYLSLYFMRHRTEYYRRLEGIREGDWEAWVAFFLNGIATIAEESVSTARSLFARVSEDRTRALAADTSSLMGLRLLEQLPQGPILSTKRAMTMLATTKPTAQKAICSLEQLGILVEVTGRKRDRVYRYETYLELLGSGED